MNENTTAPQGDENAAQAAPETPDTPTTPAGGEGSTSADEQATGDIADNGSGSSLDASAAATDLQERLNPYQQWQKKWGGDLMDGTVSQDSYIVVARGDGIQYGLQPRIMRSPCGHIVLLFRARVAHVVRAVQDGSEPLNLATAEAASPDEVDAKMDALFDFVGGFKDWAMTSPARVSRIFQFHVPVEVNKEGGLSQFLKLLDDGLFDKLIGTLPTPAAGWDTSDLRRAKQQWHEYLQLTVNQFKIFNIVQVTEQPWLDDAEPAGELTEELVGWAGKLGTEPQDGDDSEG